MPVYIIERNMKAGTPEEMAKNGQIIGRSL